MYFQTFVNRKTVEAVDALDGTSKSKSDSDLDLDVYKKKLGQLGNLPLHLIATPSLVHFTELS